MITVTEYTTFNQKAINRVVKWISFYNMLAKRWSYATLRFNSFTMTANEIHKPKMIPLESGMNTRIAICIQNNILQFVYNRIFNNVMQICK